MIKYLKIDFYRMLTSRSFFSAVVGCAMTFFAGYYQTHYSIDIFQSIFFMKMNSYIMILFAFATVAFANVFVEDSENKYWHTEVIRGEIKPYACSKVIVCYCSSIISIVIGIILYISILRFRLPFLSENDNLVNTISPNEGFGNLISQNKIIGYFLVSAVIMGFLSGILSVFSMLVSLYVKNRMFVICVPVIAFYFWSSYFQKLFGNIKYFDLSAIYLGNEKTFSSPIVTFLYAFGLSVLLCVFMGKLIYNKVYREIRGEKNA